MDVARESPGAEDVLALLRYHLERAAEHTPPDYAHALPLDGLRGQEITFWTVREAGALLGFAALKALDGAQGEVKSMRTAPHAVRRGVAARLMDTIRAEARQRGYRTLWLETGTGDVYAPARALYARFGFAPCGPFAGYPQSPHNYFMKLDLS